MTQIDSQPDQQKTVTKNKRNTLNTLDLSKRAAQQKGITIRLQLLRTLIPTVLISLILAMATGYIVIRQNSEKKVQKELQDKSLLTAEIVSQLLTKTSEITTTIGENPYIINAVRSGGEYALKEKLTTASITELEKRFRNLKLLKPNSDLNQYLRAIANNHSFLEIMVTEKNGLNIAYNQRTSDFVQRDEDWWQQGKNQDLVIGTPGFDTFSNAFSIPFTYRIKDPKSQDFLGIVRVLFSVDNLKLVEIFLQHSGIIGSQKIQIIDGKTGYLISTIDSEGTQQDEIFYSNKNINYVLNTINEAAQKRNVSASLIKSLISQDTKINELEIQDVLSETGHKILTISLADRGRQYKITTIPQTKLTAIVSMSQEEIASAGSEFIIIFITTAVILTIIATILIIFISSRITSPLRDLSTKAEEVAAGNLNITATPVGAIETKTLAVSFNNLVQQVKKLLQQQETSLKELEKSRQKAEMLAQEQQRKNESLQQELVQLLGDVEGASSGDLTVRSQIVEGEIGIVADFFNSIIESLRDIVKQVKESADQVDSSIGTNKGSMNQLAEEARQQAEQISQTLASIERMTGSIQAVANNAREAAKVANIASDTAETGGQSMDRTVNSILQLRETISETADQVRSLGEASQQISRVISLINQIAMQTNLLAINASIEAARAGDEGRGFAVVAEEIGELATQSAQATKEVGSIITTIQKEVAQVVAAMEVGNTQVGEGANLVEQTKQSLEQILTVSYQIDRLVQSISETTVSQAETSQVVTHLMKEIAQVSERTSSASEEVSSSLDATVAVAQKLQASVGTFKIDEEN
ncbi:MAG: methyl-accepting chemotaxis protein [Xenococcaceae cyanobacterium MO_188.B32]|nr:methyl-accepting chemotaxis protein [Xenococcaceae cyanobacterium MO_188.B32]